MTSTNKSVQENRSDRVAEALSLAFHPFIVIVPTMVIAIVQQGHDVWQALFWTAMAVCIVILPLVFLIYTGVKSGRYSDRSVSIREQRHILYAAAGFLMILLLAILIVGNAPLILFACLVSAVFTTLISSAINARFTKLSLHSVGMAGSITVLMLTVPILGIAMAAFAPLVGWARIHLRHHTPLQILIGWTVPAVCVLIVFRFFRLP